MTIPKDYRPLGCRECAGGAGLDFEFTMALQPIVNTRLKTVFAQEALVRGIDNQSAGQVFKNVNDGNRYRFDQACRVKAIELAAQLKVTSLLSINFMPNAVYRPELCIRATLEAADTYKFPVEQIIFEITEGEKIDDVPHLQAIIRHYQERGFKTALDDFGAGYAGLNLLADLQTDLIKLDMALIRDIDKVKSRRAIVRGIVGVCRDLDIEVIAEGVETRAELTALEDLGIELFQGYLLARPAFRAVAALTWPEPRVAAVIAPAPEGNPRR